MLPANANADAAGRQYPPEHLREVFAAYVGLRRMLCARGHVHFAGERDSALPDWPTFRNRFCDETTPEDDPAGMGVTLRSRKELGCVARNAAGVAIVCRWADEPKIGVKWLAGVRSDADREQAARAIVIGLQQMTPFARTGSAAHARRGLVIEFFAQFELCCSPLSHSLSPVVTALGRQEQRALLRRLGLQEKGALPRLLRTDPVSRELGLATGQVVKMTRALRTVPFEGATVTEYRVVV